MIGRSDIIYGRAAVAIVAWSTSVRVTLYFGSAAVVVFLVVPTYGRTPGVVIAGPCSTINAETLIIEASLPQLQWVP